MPPRVATVILDMNIGPYSIKAVKAGAIGSATAKSIDSSMTKATGSTQKLGQATGVLPSKFGTLAKVGGGAFAAIGLAGFAAVKTFSQFDQAMDAVAASTGATEDELTQLGATAIQVAADTKFSATEAARGIEALGKAGISTADIIGGALKGAMDLAAAGEVEVAEAAELAAGAMTQFGLSGEDVPHIADLMAAAAGKAQGSVSDMAMAMKQGGLVASQMGLTIEETSGVLGAFASNALIGSDAGTSLRTMLLRLMNPSGEAAALMEDLGIHAYSASGQFVGMASLAGQLQNQMGRLGQAERDAALATIFGSDAIRAANVLYKEGLTGVKAWEEKVNDSGFASEQAAARTDNLAGDLERLKGALEQVGITAGETADGPLRWLTQRLEDLLEATAAFLAAEDNLDTQTLGVARGYGTLAAEVDKATEAEEKAAEAAAFMATERQRDAAMADRYTEATEAAEQATVDQTEAMEELRQEAFDSANAILGLRDANVGFEQAIDDASAAVEDNGRSMDINSQKGRDNRTALDRVAAAALGVMKQMEDTGASEDDKARAGERMREQLIKTYRQFDNNKGRAEAYADSILNIPKTATTDAVFRKRTAQDEVNAYKEAIKGLPREVASTFRISLRVLESRGGFQGGSAGPIVGGFPLPGGPGRYRVTQGPHDGGAIDYAAAIGTPVRAPYAGYLDTRDAGARSYGKYYTLFGGGRSSLGAHLSMFARGDGRVSAGTLIGYTGNSGNSTGPHFHYRAYEKGGWVQDTGPIYAHGGEFVVNAAASARNAGALQAMNAGRGGGDTYIFPNYVGDKNDLVRALDDLRRQGRVA